MTVAVLMVVVVVNTQRHSRHPCSIWFSQHTHADGALQRMSAGSLKFVLSSPALASCPRSACACRHGPKRADYIGDFWKVVNWDQVSKNFAAAKAGKVQALVE